MIQVASLINSKYPGLLDRYPGPVKHLILYLLRSLLKENEINRFLEQHGQKKGLDFIDELFEYLDFSYTISAKDRLKIKSEGRLLIIANHPLGGLDGLVLLKLISEVRKDVQVVVNDFLLSVEPLAEHFLPYDLTKVKAQSKNIKTIIDALNHEKAVIIFPAGVVSRFSLKGIKDGKWNKGVLFFANATSSPVLPIHISARNSAVFYTVALFSNLLSMLMLPQQLFNKRGKNIDIKIGHEIPFESIAGYSGKNKTTLKLLKKHLYRIGKGKQGIFKTVKNIIHPVGRKELKKQIADSNILGSTPDGKLITLLNYDDAPDVMKEVGRLREMTFRKVGEGTGAKVDLDFHDKIYKHIVLWDESELEIVGSYRVGDCKRIVEDHSIHGLYTTTLFNLPEEVTKLLPETLELGRSFVSARYWNSFALDYLWQGIGKYLINSPGIRYLLGPVSLSNSYTKEAKELIIYFYRKWHGTKMSGSIARNPFVISPKRELELDALFNGENYRKEFLILRNLLQPLGFTVPVLFKQYTELCEPGGVKFLDFSVDHSFANCVDGLILVDLHLLKADKRNRYLRNEHKNAV